MKTRKENVELVALTRKANFIPDTVDAEKRTAELVWTTGARVKRGGFWVEPYEEELSLKRSHVRLERLNSGAPLLNNHSAFDLSDVVGVVEKASIKDGEGIATVRFSENESVDDIFNNVKNGIIRNISVGYRVHKYEEITEKAAEGEEKPIRVLRATDWEPLELSLVPIPADAGAQVRSEEAKNICEFNLRGNEVKIEPTKTEGAPVVDAPAKVVDTDAIRKEAVESERMRVSEIRSACAKVGLEGEFCDKLINDAVDADKARGLIIDEKAARDAAADVKGANVAVTRDENETRVKGAENALLHRVSPSANKLDDLGREYRSLTMLELGREFCEAHGIKTRGMDKMEIAKRAFHSTSDFPILLANVANKTLRGSYAEAPQTFRPLVREVYLSDFKAVDRVQMGGGALDLREQGEGGEVTYGTVGEAKEQIALKTYSRGFSFTRQMMINDDLDALARIPMLFGRKVRKKESDLVWGIITANANMADSNALFSSSHLNLAGSGAAISETTVGAGRLAMRTQVDLDGDIVEIAPRIMAVPAALETAAQKFLQATIVATKDADTNIFKGAFDLIVEPRLDTNSATAWYLFASPMDIDLIELGYLQGEIGPVLDQEQGFDVDGMKMKVRVDLGAKAIDWRGMYKNAGA